MPAIVSVNRRALSAVLLLALVSCGKSSSSADLPSGWSGAQRITDFTQKACSGSALTGPPAVVQASAIKNAIDVEYLHADFRCQQDVEGFVRENGTAIDLLVQPIDLHPKNIVRCDCLYDIMLEVSATPGSHRVTVYRRWDAINVPNDPLLVGHTDVVVPAK